MASDFRDDIEVCDVGMNLRFVNGIRDFLKQLDTNVAE